MSHVDDGTLHEYLDGQLAPGERAQLEAHLASCPACQARLEEERALIARADALLALATPPDRAIPPFHQLRHPWPAWRFRLPAVWAATVLLALGLGWYLGGGLGARRAAPPNNGVLATRADTGAADALALQPAQPTRELRQQSTGTPRTTPARGRADEGAGEQAPADTLVSAAHLQSATAVVRAEPRAQLKATPPTPAASAPPPSPSPAGMEGVTVRDQAAQSVRARDYVALTTSWTIVPLDAARATLGVSPLTIPGLPLRDVRRSPLDAGVILVEQTVDQATVVQLFQRRVDQPEAGLRPRADSIAYRRMSKEPRGEERLARYVGPLRVEIAGPLSTDSLSKLLELVK